jgi:hypothetical protein
MKAVKLSKRAKLLTSHLNATEIKKLRTAAENLYQYEMISSSRFMGIMRHLERVKRKF